MGQAEDLQSFRAFVARSRWKCARTYVESYPHEYSLERWGDPDFWRSILSIEQYGVVEQFWNASRKYLYLDDRKYWHMGDVSSEKPEDRPTLINRTWLDVSAYRDEARLLGYEEEALDRVSDRWKALLERARRGA
jgi:hypothetical protein